MNLMTMGPLVATRRKWTNPYITDGLVAMWDGEWNVEGGKHDASVTDWTDIVSGIVANHANGTISVGAKSYSLDSGNRQVCAMRFNLTSELLSGVYAIECCYALTRLLQSASPFAVKNYSGSTRRTYCLSTIATGETNLIDGNGQYFKGSADGARSVSYNLSHAWPPVSSAMQNNQGVDISASRSAGYNIEYGTDICGIGSAGAEVFCLRLYSRALTSDEVAANYAVDKERFDL